MTSDAPAHRPERALFAFAGLWESWSPGDAPPVESCTILTTSASSALENIHHRMPVILEPGDWPRWLDCGDGRSPAPVELLAPRDDLAGDPLVFHPVSRRVNNPRNDDAACLEPAP